MNYIESFDLIGEEAKQIPNITGAGAPTTSTDGAVGCLYMDTSTGDMYKCTMADGGVYTWILTTPTVVQGTGESAEAVMSQKAVTDVLGGKVDKITVKNKVYGTDKDGNQIGYDVNSNVVADAIPRRTWDGNIYVPATPSDTEYSATSKKYVDDKLASKVDKITASGYRVYASDSGTFKQYQLAPNGNSGTVAWYSLPANSGTGTEPTGTLSGCTPTNKWHFTNKKYVDGIHLSVDLDPATYVLSIKLVSDDDTVLSEHEIDLPLESMVVGAEVSDDEKSLTLTLNNDEKTQVTFSVADLMSELASKEYVDDEDAKKLDKITNTSLTGIGGGAYILKQDGTQGMIKITNTVAGSTVPWRGSGGVVVVGMPTADTHATPRKYVDDNINPIRLSLASALGSRIETNRAEYYNYFEQTWPVPENALPFIKIETAYYDYSYGVYTNEETGEMETGSVSANITKVFNGAELVDIPEDGFVKVADGATEIEFAEPVFSIPDGAFYMGSWWNFVITYQTKVGV